MARDTAAIGTDVVIGSNTPDVETTVEALIRAYNRQPLDSGLSEGDMVYWDATAEEWVAVSGTKAEGQLPTVQADGSIAWENGSSLGVELSSRYALFPEGRGGTTETMLADRVYAVRVDFRTAGTLTDVALGVTSAGDGSAVVRAVLAEWNDGNPTGAAHVADIGSFDGTSATNQEITGLSIAVDSGAYWLALLANDESTTTPTVHAVHAAVPNGVNGSLATVLGGSRAPVTAADNTGAIPDPLPSFTTARNSSPAAALKGTTP